MTNNDPKANNRDLSDAEAAITALNKALAHQRQLTEQERRRADLAEASRDTAWRVAAGRAIPKQTA